MDRVSDLHVFSDSLGEVHKLKSSIVPINEDGFVVRDIRAPGDLLNVLSFSYMSRSYNLITHILAKHAFNRSTHSF